MKVLWMLSLLMLASCDYYEAKKNRSQSPAVVVGEENRISFNEVFTAIFQPRCLRCHKGPNAKGDVDFTNWESLVGSGWAVTPGDPENSFLYVAVAEGIMPPKSPLPEEQIEMIRTWILEGARE